jgi:glyceraldehyde-3-phosphate dehydrogenase (ferredoxin)
MGSPMPVMGKYYVYYGGGFITPDELGRKNVQRMVYELINDNCGVCRFHRQWSEPLLDTIINDRFGLDVDFKRHHFELARAINEHERGKAVPWETERMGELFMNYLEYCRQTGPEEDFIFHWQNHPDTLLTAQAFWQSILDAQEKAFAAGADQLPDAPTPKEYRERAG